MKSYKEGKCIQSYVYTDYGNFFVSTCYRKSSAMLSPNIWYFETFAWRLNEMNKRTDWVVEEGGGAGLIEALELHFEVCKQLLEKGEYKKEE